MNRAGQVLQAARQRGWRIVTAESCTGGMVAVALTDIAGSSDVFERGFVTYSNESKQQMLGVSAATLAKFGAVSEEVAAEMARGALKASPADIAIAITGVAGPGGSENKPEGLVCFAIASKDGAKSERVLFGPLGRQKVRQASAEHALALLLGAIKR